MRNHSTSGPRDVVTPILAGADTSPIDVDSASETAPRLADIKRLGDSGGTPVVLLGRYHLDAKIGTGGTSAVYRSTDLRTGREVAIKILDDELRCWCHGFSSFIRESKMASHIHHPNVIDVLEFGTTPTGIVYLVMELLRGRDLAHVAGRGISWRWARYMMRQVCKGVGAIHRAGIVHGDLKASNCFFVRSTATVKILDLGIATNELANDETRKRPRLIIGTPANMAPERIRGERADRRADVYAAGVLMYQLLARKLPFVGSVDDVFEQHLTQVPPPIHELAPDVRLPAGIDRVLRGALAKDRDERFSTMAEFDAALGTLDDSPLQRRHHTQRAYPSV